MTYKLFLKGEPTTFDKVFPSVKSLILTGKEHGDFREFAPIPVEHRSDLHYTESNLPAKIPCSNSRCQQGGYELQWMLDRIVRSCDTHYEKTFHCGGHEGSTKGRRKGDSCCNYIDITIELEYKDENGT
jgi:hypothetical protein